ncbi:MAG: alpha/beta fold hydrolase [Alphaproteobacteria bacterium]
MLVGPVVLHKSPKVNQLVVILHGYGADGDNLIDLAHSWAPHFPEADFLAPNAPEACESNPMGYQWFGLRDFTPFNVRAGLDRIRPTVVHYLKAMLQERQLGVQDLTLVGFSQGAMLALDMIFALPGLNGVLAYSGAFYPPVAAEKPVESTPVMLVHGMVDVVVPFVAMAEAERQLRLFGITPQTEAIPHLGHGIDGHSIMLGQQFLQQLFTKQQPVFHMAQ